MTIFKLLNKIYLVIVSFLSFIPLRKCTLNTPPITVCNKQFFPVDLLVRKRLHKKELPALPCYVLQCMCPKPSLGHGTKFVFDSEYPNTLPHRYPHLHLLTHKNKEGRGTGGRLSLIFRLSSLSIRTYCNIYFFSNITVTTIKGKQCHRNCNN